MQSIDLGPVVGPAGQNGSQGERGEQGLPGRSLYFDNQDPESDFGAEGDVFINSETGQVFRKEAQTPGDESTVEWVSRFQINLSGATIDEQLDDESTNPVQNAAITAAIQQEAEDRAQAVSEEAQQRTKQEQSTLTRTSGVTAKSTSSLNVYRKGAMGCVWVVSYDSWSMGVGNVPYTFRSGWVPLFPQHIPAQATVAGVSSCLVLMRLETDGGIRVVSPAYKPSGGTATGMCTEIRFYGSYVGRW